MIEDPDMDAMCTCGHNFGFHSSGTEGPCWYDHSSCPCPHWNAAPPVVTVPEEAPAPLDPIKVEALRLAVQMSTAGKLGLVTEIAREFETYLRGAADVRPDPVSVVLEANDLTDHRLCPAQDPLRERRMCSEPAKHTGRHVYSRASTSEESFKECPYYLDSVSPDALTEHAWKEHGERA